MSCVLRKGVDPEYIDTMFLQMQPIKLHHTDSSESQDVEPAPKKQCTEQMKSFADTSETTNFQALCPPRSIRFSELFKNPGPFGPSIQVRKVCFHWVA